MARTSKPEVEEGSGNVFADLGLANPEQERLKARLTLEIYKILKERGLRQSEAAKLLGTSQPRVSELMHGRSGMFSASYVTYSGSFILGNNPGRSLQLQDSAVLIITAELATEIYCLVVIAKKARQDTYKGSLATNPDLSREEHAVTE